MTLLTTLVVLLHSYVLVEPYSACMQTKSQYSHLFNKRGGWNKSGGGAKVAKSLNVELGINEEGGIFGKN